MKNELFSIGPITVYGYGLMIAIGVLSAYLSAEYRAKKKGLDYEKIFDLTIWAAVGGILGAKVLYYITQFKEIIADPKLLLDVGNGFVVYGGIIGGILSGYAFCRKHKWNFIEYFDLVMPSIALAQGFGRIGCFLAGCCYGIETDCKFALTFHSSDYAPNNVPLVPTQLMSSALDFLNFFILITIAKKNKVKGKIAAFYLMFYSAGRFVLEFFRGDLERGSVGNISTSQFISIFLFAFGAILLLVRIKITKKEEKEMDDFEGDSIDESEETNEDSRKEDKEFEDDIEE